MRRASTRRKVSVSNEHHDHNLKKKKAKAGGEFDQPGEI